MKEHCLKALWLCRCVQACLMLGVCGPTSGGVGGVEISLKMDQQVRATPYISTAPMLGGALPPQSVGVARAHAPSPTSLPAPLSGCDQGLNEIVCDVRVA